MDNQLIKKRILHTGSKVVTYENGTKVKFHFCTKKCDEEGTLVDDSKKTNSPMELIIGKKFKLEAWETAVQTMALNEVASFTVDKSLVSSYPFVAKTLRDLHKPKKEHHKSHCCAADLQTYGVGYEDLNQILRNPCDLEFILEVIQVEGTDEYVKESWQMDDEQKKKAIPQLKEAGNELYHSKEYKQAAVKYGTAISHLEQLMLKEKPKDEEWNELNKQKLPLLLNFAQCKLLDGDYYAVIEHCTTVLQSDPNNVKALYRRGKAHIGAWNCKDAADDFYKVKQLDPTLSKLVNKDLQELDQLKRAKDMEDKAKLVGKMF